MMKAAQEIVGLRKAARRVVNFFLDKPIHDQCIERDLPQKHLKELIDSHNYLLIKSAASLGFMSTFSFARSNTVRKKKLESLQMVSTPNKERISDRIDDTPCPEGGLSRGRVHGWQLKEYFLVKKQLQSFSETPQPAKHHEISPLPESDPAQESLDQTQEWQNQLGYKEERQFQITRITKILSS